MEELIEDQKLRKAEFRIDLSDLEFLTREVGYYNAKANFKYYDEDGNDIYDDEDIKKYEELRTKQLEMLKNFIEKYGN